MEFRGRWEYMWRHYLRFNYFPVPEYGTCAGCVSGPCLLSLKTGAEITCAHNTLPIPPALSPNIPLHTPSSLTSPPSLWQPHLQKKKPLKKKKKNLRQWNIWDVRACCAKRTSNHFTPLSAVSERYTATISFRPSLSLSLSELTELFIWVWGFVIRGNYYFYLYVRGECVVCVCVCVCVLILSNHSRFKHIWVSCSAVHDSGWPSCSSGMNHTHTHTRLFCELWGTFHRRDGFYTVQTIFSIALHLNLSLTGNFVHFYFLKKTHSVMIYKPFEIWGHWVNVLISHLLLVIPMSYHVIIQICVLMSQTHTHTQHTHTHTHAHAHTHTHTNIIYCSCWFLAVWATSEIIAHRLLHIDCSIFSQLHPLSLIRKWFSVLRMSFTRFLTVTSVTSGLTDKVL